jgi:hypothetical protein
MICHKHKFIFIHHRKTAGSSIISSFGFSPGTLEWNIFNNGTMSENHAWSEKNRLWPNYLVGAVVRNPWDRFVSGWKYCNTTRQKPLLKVLENMPCKGHDYRHLTRLQIDTLLDESGKMVADFLLRFENLQEDFDVLCEVIGKQKQILPISNTTKHRHYQEYFTTSIARERFERLFQKDIDYFGYSF